MAAENLELTKDLIRSNDYNVISPVVSHKINSGHIPILFDFDPLFEIAFNEKLDQAFMAILPLYKKIILNTDPELSHESLNSYKRRSYRNDTPTFHLEILGMKDQVPATLDHLEKNRSEHVDIIEQILKESIENKKFRITLMLFGFGCPEFKGYISEDPEHPSIVHAVCSHPRNGLIDYCPTDQFGKHLEGKEHEKVIKKIKIFNEGVREALGNDLRPEERKSIENLIQVAKSYWYHHADKIYTI